MKNRLRLGQAGLFWREVPDGGVHLVGLKVFCGQSGDDLREKNVRRFGETRRGFRAGGCRGGRGGESRCLPVPNRLMFEEIWEKRGAVAPAGSMQAMEEQYPGEAPRGVPQRELPCLGW